MSILGINSSITRDLYTAVQTAFNTGFAEASVQLTYPYFTSILSTTKRKLRLDYGYAMTDLVKWKDERKHDNIEVDDFEMTHQPYEKTIEVDRKDLDDDDAGVYANIAYGLGKKAALKVEKEVANLINLHMTATTSTDYQAGFDALALFSRYHVWPSSASTYYDNLRGAATSNAGKLDATYALTNIEGAYTDMVGFKDNNGDPMGIVPDMIVTAPGTAAIEVAKVLQSSEVQRLYRATTDASDATGVRMPVNVVPGFGLQHVVCQYLTAGTGFLCNTRDMLKPVLLLQRQGPRWREWFDEERDAQMYGVDIRFGVASGPWWMAVGFDAT